MSSKGVLWNDPLVRFAHGFESGWELWESTYSKTEWDRDALTRLRLERATAIVEHARAHVPAYRDVLDGDTPFTALSRLPIVDKERVGVDLDRYLARNSEQRHLVSTLTSGTTGQRAQFVHDRSRFVEGIASTLRLWHAHDLPLGARLLRFTTLGESPLTQFAVDPGWLFSQKLSINIPRVDDRNARYLNELIADFSPQVLWGQPVDLLGLCHEIASGRIEIGSGARGAFSHGDLLTPEMKQLVEEMLQMPIFDIYGMQEFGRVAWSCPEAPGTFHVDSERFLVEVGDGNEAEEGELIVTGLTNFAMPLLRYRIGDHARLVRDPCSCGRALERLEGMQGRERGYIRDRRGRLINSMNVLKTMSLAGLARWRVHQPAAGELDVLVVAPDGKPVASEQRKQIEAKLRSLVDLAAVSVRDVSPEQLVGPGGKSVLFTGLVSKQDVVRELALGTRVPAVT
jgi:phenylacetate-CoA ligase